MNASDPALARRDTAAACSVAQTLPAAEGERAGARASPGRIGRFTVLGRLGAGAMGVVYAAYDDILDRKVAVKVLHDTDAIGQRRLVREAQAMARVSHPNVVSVLEAGLAEGQVYVAMEFVRGTTLAAWLAASRRAWPEIRDVFVQAGRGLAAAHAAGLVHRDFKPSNVMLDASGRVVVLDFGLVRAVGEATPAPDVRASTSHGRLDHRITDDGELLGTPAFMAPEQWRGLRPEPASDQFSFCVALYEALFEQAPFAGRTLLELARATTSEPPREPPRRAPAWLSALVLRGLRREPKDRFPSMAALLVALERRRARGGRLAAAAGVLALGAASLGFALARGEPPCVGSAAELARTWDAGRRDRVHAALAATAPSYTAAVWPQVEADLEARAARWQQVRRDACLAHARGEVSETLYTAQTLCLDRWRGALDETLTALAAADAEVASRTLEVVGALARQPSCADLDALTLAAPPPELRPAVADLRVRLARAEVLARAGRRVEALALADALIPEADGLEFPPVRAEALLLRGRLGIDAQEPATALARRLDEAMIAGLRAQSDAIAAEALALRIFAYGRQPELAARAIEDERLALALADRAPAPAVLRGLVFNNLGTVHLARRDRARARHAFEEALALRTVALGPRDREVGLTQMNLALVSDPGPEREAALRRALAILDEALGPAHPDTIEARVAAAALAVDPAAARELLVPACAALDRYHADDPRQGARCHLHLGRLAAELGDAGDAAVALRRAGALVVRAGGAGALGEPERGLLVGHLGLVTGQHEAALAALESALAGLEDVWWTQSDRAELRGLLGANLLARGRVEAAVAALRAAEADAAALAEVDVQWRPRLAGVRRELARALLAAGAGQEARSQLAAALAGYRAAGPSHRAQLAAAERLEAALPDEADRTRREDR